MPSSALPRFTDDEYGSIASSWYVSRDIRALSALVQTNPILSSAVLRIRSAVGSLPVIADESESPGRHKADQDYWLRSLRTPSAGSTRSSFFSEIAWVLISCGECFIRVRPGKAQAIFQILGQDWRIARDSNTSQPLYIVDGSENKLDLVSWAGRRETEDFAIRISIMDMGRRSHVPLRAALMAQSVFDNIYRQALSILKNKPAISGVLSTNSRVGREQQDAIEEAVNRYTTDGIRAGGILFIGNSDKTSFDQFDSGLDGVLTPKAREDAGSDIAIALGVPLEIIGLGDKTYANMQTARVVFMEGTVLPIYGEPILAAISSAVLPPFAPLTIDKDQIEALRISRISAMKDMSQVDFLSIDDKRAFFGYAPEGKTDD